MRLFLHIALLFLPLAAHSLTLSQLHDRVHASDSHAGWFVQCTIHGESAIVSSGEYLFKPRYRLRLQFHQPSEYAVVLSRDGTQVKTVHGEEQAPRHSRAGKLLFDLMSMREESLQRYFETDLTGDMHDFHLRLTPTKRMAKFIREAEARGTDGNISELQITARDGRALIVRLLDAPPDNPSCK